MTAPLTCAGCLAFAPGVDRTVSGKAIGQCRRQSPAPSPATSRSYVDAQWPDVKPDDWCCEFVAAGTPISVIVNRGDAA